MAHTLSPEEYQELGKTYYKRKQYEKAVETFTKGIEASVIPTVTLFDYRAASYEKLSDFNAAVKDGREAIRLNKRDIKGYLRTGSVLQKMNKLDTAVNIYKYGMRNVPVDNRDFQLLQQLHDKLTRKLSPAKAIDPFTILPIELVEMILGYLPFKNIVGCLRVSKGWKNYLIRRPKLWLDLDLSGASKPVSRKFIANAVRYSENAVNRLTVYRFQHTDILRNIATACKGLRELEILSLPLMLSETLIEFAQCALNLKKLVIRTEVSLDTATQIIRRRPTLEYAEFTSIISAELNADWKGPFPHLHTLLMNGPPGRFFTRNLSLDSMLAQSPALKSFALVHWGAVINYLADTTLFSQTTLTSLILKDVGMWSFPRLPATLKAFILQPVKPLALPQGPDAGAAGHPGNVSWDNALHSNLPHLVHLGLREILDLTPEFLDALLDVYVSENGELKRFEEDQREDLQHLSLSGQFAFSPTPTTLFAGNGLLTSPRILSRSLTSLSVSTLPCTDDDVEALLSQPTTNLQSVDLSSTRITGASIKMLADGLPNLGYVKADNCRDISSRDAVAYAEKKGIVISCKMSDAFGSGGRRVRYG